jgi:hypothetical protein
MVEVVLVKLPQEPVDILDDFEGSDGLESHFSRGTLFFDQSLLDELSLIRS